MADGRTRGLGHVRPPQDHERRVSRNYRRPCVSSQPILHATGIRLRGQVAGSKNFVTTVCLITLNDKKPEAAYPAVETGGVDASEFALAAGAWFVPDFYARCCTKPWFEARPERRCRYRAIRVHIALRIVPWPKRQGRRIFCKSYEGSAGRSHDAIKKEWRRFPVSARLRDGRRAELRQGAWRKRYADLGKSVHRRKQQDGRAP